MTEKYDPVPSSPTPGPSNLNSKECNCSRRKIKGCLSYRKIYDASSKHPIYWIPNQHINLTIQNVPDDHNLLKINLEHGKFKWSVTKTPRDLDVLHRTLRRHRLMQKIHRPRMRKIRNGAEKLAHDENCPCFEPHREVKTEKVHPNLKQLKSPPRSEENQRLLNENIEGWLRQTVNSSIYKHYNDIKNFLEISPYSFINEVGPKYKEGIIKIRYIKDNKFNIKNLKEFLLRLFSPWKKRWLLVKDSFVALIDIKKKAVRWVILFDEGFAINKPELEDEIKGPKEFTLSDQNQDLRLKCSKVEDAQRWKDTFAQIFNSSNRYWLQPKRFGSSYSPRDHNYCQVLVDGESFFDKISDMIELAKDEIFIGSWWICPELYMKRPMAEGDKWRLDRLLLRAAERGVHIFILQYNELTFAFGHNSIYGKRQLKKLHKNIKIMRHPDHFSDQGTVRWAHHEKFLVIDQLIAFIGGTDLCFGRWDNETHSLKDLGSVAYVPSKFARKVSIPDEVSRDPSKVQELEENLFKRPMSSQRIENLDVETISESGDSIENYKMRYTHVQETHFDVSKLHGGGIFYPGKEYVNLNFHDFEEVDKPFKDQIDRYKIPRLPWHDCNAMVIGEAARDLARHFVQRWNATKAEKFRSDQAYPYLLPKSYDSITIPDVFLSNSTPKCQVQVLRSASNWSAGINRTETSILQAYKDLIANAKHYVYIENLYFVSMIDSEDVTNGICEVLCDRIVRADRHGENFRAFIMLPLRPGYAGDIRKDEYTTLTVLLNLNYMSISRGPNSLIENLKKKGVADPWRYLSVTSLRTWDEFCGNLETEMVYIHSKAMIVDDQHVILGSCNINDRSMLGDRDSEVDMLISDSEFIDSKMNGRPYRAGKFAYAMRMRLMKEHLGLSSNMPQRLKSKIDHDLDDPVSDHFFDNVWKFQAKKNIEIYDEVFHTFPTDRIKNYDDLEKWRESNLAKQDYDLSLEKLKDISGYIIEFPTDFLKEENLSPQIGTKEYLIPEDVYT